jgi:hypothetical protein
MAAVTALTFPRLTTRPMTMPHATADNHTTIVPAFQERRTLHRLRDLCDEVIASYRAARGASLFSDADRREANALLGQLVLVKARRR